MDKQASTAQSQSAGENQARADRVMSARGYTGKFTSLITVGLGLFVFRDLSAKGPRHISMYFGVSSRVWTWFWLIAGAILSWWLASRMSLNKYFMRVVKEHKHENPIDPIEAGVFDVSTWATLGACLITVFAFVFIPGWFGIVRPFLVVLTAIVLATSFSLVLTNRIVKALYTPTRVRKTISRTQCQMVFAQGTRCVNWALRAGFRRVRTENDKKPGHFCRWHLIGVVTAALHAKKRRAPLNKQYLAALFLAIALFASWNSFHDHALLWSMVLVFCLGATFRFLAESIIVPWFALSKLAFWSKLLTLGLGSQALAGIVILIVAGRWPETLKPLVNLAPAAKWWVAFGPVVLYLIVTLLTAFAVDILSERILFLGPGSLASLFALGTFLPIWQMSAAAVSQYPLFNAWFGEDFWKQVIGGRVRPIQAVAFFAGMSVPFVLWRRRRSSRQQASVGYGRTMAEILAPAALSFLSMLLSRYALLAIGMTGSFWFIIVTFALSVTLSWLMLPLVNRYQAHTRSSTADAN